MRKHLAISAMTLALTLSGCGDKETAAPGTSAEAMAKVPAPSGKQWGEVVSKTKDGGFVMGNPEAPIKIVEYGSLTCSHCAEFDEKAFPALRDDYVNSGRVSYELRNFLLNSIDVPAAILSRCGGADSYFALSEQFFKNQAEIFQNLQNVNQNAAESAMQLPEDKRFIALAKALGLTDFFKARGVSEDQANACLADPKAVTELTDMQKVANEKYEISGTPTFIINGEKADFNTWPVLANRLQEMGAR